MEEPEKFTAVELTLGTFALFGLDVICFIIDWTGVGLAIAPVLQAGGSFATSWWLKRKGGENAFALGRQLGKYASNILPFVPTLTIAFWIETYLHNHPKNAITQVTEKVGSIRTIR